MNVRRQLLGSMAAAAALVLGASAAHAQEVVKIGYSGPLSGGAALYGKNVLDGMQMAINEINAEGTTIGGKAVKFEIVALDDKYNPSETAINAQRLVQEHKAAVILCPHSGGGFAVQANNESQKLLLLSYTSVPQITERGNKLTWRVPPLYTSYIPAFIEHAMGKFGKNVAFLAGDHDYAKNWAASFKPAWEAAGGKVVVEAPMSYNRAADFYSGVSRGLAAKPDVLFVGGASEPTGLVIKQARELGFKGGFIVLDQAKFDEIARVTGGYGPLEGSIGVLPLTEDTSAASKDFVQRFVAAYPGRIATSESAINYSAIHATVRAMRLAGTTSDATAIRAQLDKGMKEVPPNRNPYLMRGVEPTGGSVVDTRVAVVDGGKIRVIEVGPSKK